LIGGALLEVDVDGPRRRRTLCGETRCVLKHGAAH
jgi:hypothetical protein